MHSQFWSEILKERDSLREGGVVRSILLKCILNKVGECKQDSTGSGQKPVAGNN